MRLDRDFSKIFSGNLAKDLVKSAISEGCYGRVVELHHHPRAVVKRKKTLLEDQSRWKDEAKLMKRLMHPNIVSYYGFFNDSLKEDYGIVMEFCENESARSLINNAKISYSMDVVIYWTNELFDALSYLHFNGVIHRDICLENIFVTKEFTIKLGDFGCTTATESLLNKVVGRDRYRSPEQYGNEDEHAANHEYCDVYSMGLAIYEMIQREPFLKDNLSDEVLYTVAGKLLKNQESPAIPIANCDNAQLKSFLARCISVQYTKRPSAIEMRDAMCGLMAMGEYPKEQFLIYDDSRRRLVLPNKFHKTFPIKHEGASSSSGIASTDQDPIEGQIRQGKIGMGEKAPEAPNPNSKGGIDCKKTEGLLNAEVSKSTSVDGRSSSSPSSSKSRLVENGNIRTKMKHIANLEENKQSICHQDADPDLDEANIDDFLFGNWVQRSTKKLQRRMLGNSKLDYRCFLGLDDIKRQTEQAASNFTKKLTFMTPKDKKVFTGKICVLVKKKQLEHSIFQGFDLCRGREINDIQDEDINDLFRDYLDWHFYLELHQHSELVYSNVKQKFTVDFTNEIEDQNIDIKILKL